MPSTWWVRLVDLQIPLLEELPIQRKCLLQALLALEIHIGNALQAGNLKWLACREASSRRLCGRQAEDRQNSNAKVTTRCC